MEVTKIESIKEETGVDASGINWEYFVREDEVLFEKGS